MAVRIEHFLHGTPARLKSLCADLAAGIAVHPVPDGLMLKETLASDADLDAALARIMALAVAHGVTYDGHGRCLDSAVGEYGEVLAHPLQTKTFTTRTGIKAGHGFAMPLPDGRFGHAIHLGSDRRGYLLLDISTLITDRPASQQALRDAPRRYRQPILVWHRPFAALALESSKPLTQLPSEVLFRCAVGWPSPDAMALLEERFAIIGTDQPAGWKTLLLAMARAGHRMPGLEGYSLWTARVGPTGTLKLIEDHASLPFSQDSLWPMPWDPCEIDDIVASLSGGPDIIAVKDQVT